MRVDLQDVINKTQYFIICVCYILDFYLFCLNLMANSNFTQKSYPESDNLSSLPLFTAAWHPIRTEVEFPSRCCSECFYDSLSLRGEAWVLTAALRTHATQLVLPLQTHVLWLSPAVLLQPCQGGLPRGSQHRKSFSLLPCPPGVLSLQTPTRWAPSLFRIAHNSCFFPGCMLCAC